MWQRGLAEHDLLAFDELLLTNSSIIGPLQPLAPLWQNPAVAGCDFWGLTDNDELGSHLQSYFLVFRQRVLHSGRFHDFWRTVLPYKNKQQVIYSYELGLSQWLEEGGFTWQAIFKQEQIRSAYRQGRSLFRKIHEYRLYLEHRALGRNTTVFFPDLLLAGGMPFLKTALLCESPSRIDPPTAFGLLEQSSLPVEILAELRREFPAVNGRRKS